ncbi:MAG: hypothetical protein WKF47_06385 [Geodermatophilaceae bacterium]
MNTEERSKLFDLWNERGDLAQLAEFVKARPEQLSSAWRGVAKFRAANKDFAGAYQLAKQFARSPALPQNANASSIEQLERAFYASPNNYAVGFALYDEQTRAGKTRRCADDGAALHRRAECARVLLLPGGGGVGREAELGARLECAGRRSKRLKK